MTIHCNSFANFLNHTIINVVYFLVFFFFFDEQLFSVLGGIIAI